jgi:hypothetical protein
MDALLDEREKTHGEFRITARLAQEFRGVMRSGFALRAKSGRTALSHAQQESLDIWPGDPTPAMRAFLWACTVRSLLSQ